VKGVSPIIATVLLILISIAASLLMWTWVSSTVTQTPSEISFLSERVKVEAVGIEDNVVRIFIRNLVNSDVRVGSAYIINGTSGLTLAQNVTNIVIRGGEVAELRVVLRTTLPPGVYIAKVVTSRGYEASYIFAITT